MCINYYTIYYTFLCVHYDYADEALAHPIGAYTDEDDIERELDEMAIQENEEIEALERLVSVKNGRETKAKEKISESERVATTLQKQGSNGKLSGKERELEELRKLEALLG